MKLGFAVFFLLLGCSFTPKRSQPVVPPAVTVTPDGGVTTTGDAKVPANVTTNRTISTLPLPKDSSFVLNDKLGTMTLTLPAVSAITTTTNTTSVVGPTAFTPDALPTAKDLADAKQHFWVQLGLKLGLAAGTAASLFGLVRQWTLLMLGGGVVAAACGFGLFIEQHPILLLVIGLGVAAAIVGPIIYHFTIKKYERNGRHV